MTDKIYFFDLETFQNLITATFIEKENKTLFQFVIGFGYDDSNKLKKFLNQNSVLVGYNSLMFDAPILRYMQTYNQDIKHLPGLVFKLSQKLINSKYGNLDEELKKLRYPRKDVFSWKTLDLMKIMAFDKAGVSLKQIAVNLRHEKIQDLPLKYSHQIQSQDEVDLILSYNKNDVDITEKLYYHIMPQIKLREELSELYGVDLSNASDSKIGNVVLESYYKNQLGIDIRDIRDLRTKRTSVDLKECIPSVIEFKTKELKSLKEEIENTTVYAPDFKFEKKFRFFGTDYSSGVGGIHSMEKGCKFEESDSVKIISADVASFYPNCILINKIYPEHLGEDFLKVLRILTDDRVAAKKTHKTKADSLKISVNGIFGKLNSNTFWLEDAKALIRVTIGCQLYILMLIEKLELAGIHCLSANTDGIECYCDIDKEKLYYNICKEWEEKTGFVLEYVDYHSYSKRDVNNYVAIENQCYKCKKPLNTNTCSCGGKRAIKTKGAFIPEPDLKKGYKGPVIPKSVYNYFVYNKPVEETLYECKDIMEFCISQKMADTFVLHLHEKNKTTPLQKTNRFYVSKTGGSLIKHKSDGSTSGLIVGYTCKILNDYDPNDPFEKYDINYDYYKKEAYKIIYEIEPPVKQLDMFSASVDLSATKQKIVDAEQNYSIDALKALTVLQLRKVLKSAYDKKVTIAELNPRYVYVVNVEKDFVQLYSYGKGTMQTIKYTDDKVINKGEVIYCDAFSKDEKGNYLLTKFHICDTIK